MASKEMCLIQLDLLLLGSLEFNSISHIKEGTQALGTNYRNLLGVSSFD